MINLCKNMNKGSIDDFGILVICIGIIILIWKNIFAPRSKKNEIHDTRKFKKKLYPTIYNFESDTEDVIQDTIRSQHEENIFSNIPDRFKSLADVTKALQVSGLESCSLIFGIDYTKSNEWQGQQSFGGKNLHSLSSSSFNPYQQVIRVVGETLSSFDDDGVIPAYGFGDASTRDHSVFPLRGEGCDGMSGVLAAYTQVTPLVRPSGPTCFAPLIHKAIEIVRISRSYHILVIVADGQVTKETPTVNAIVEASNVPLSIVMIGVGDGPWDQMKTFDDNLPTRRFDNFQFVEFNKVMSGPHAEARFATMALMEIPDQFKAVRSMGLLNFHN